MTHDERDDRPSDTPAFVVAALIVAAFALEQCETVQRLVDEPTSETDTTEAR